MPQRNTPCAAFAGTRMIAFGSLHEVALTLKQRLRHEPALAPLGFDNATGRPIDLDLRGSDEAIVRRLENPPADSTTSPVRAGRRKLGVVAREVTLLPRHWDWLNDQPGGASVAL